VKRPTVKRDALPAKYSWCWSCSRQLYAHRGVIVRAPGGHLARVHADCARKEGLAEVNDERELVQHATQEQIDRSRASTIPAPPEEE
jgi:hypothetical protein